MAALLSKVYVPINLFFITKIPYLKEYSHPFVLILKNKRWMKNKPHLKYDILPNGTLDSLAT